MGDTDIDHEYTDEIVCPYCGATISDSWEYADQESHEIECDCGKTFTASAHVEVTYVSRKKE